MQSVRQQQQQQQRGAGSCVLSLSESSDGLGWPCCSSWFGLELNSTYSNACGLSGPCCPNYRCLLYFKRSAWFMLSAVLMIALSLLMTMCWPQITLIRAAASHWEEETHTVSHIQENNFTVGCSHGFRLSDCSCCFDIWYFFGWGFISILVCDPALIPHWDPGKFCITDTQRMTTFLFKHILVSVWDLWDSESALLETHSRDLAPVLSSSDTSGPRTSYRGE